MPPKKEPVAEPAPEPAKEVLEVAPINGEEPAKEDRMWKPPPKKEMTDGKKKAVQAMFDGLKKKREERKAEQEKETAEAKEEKRQAKLHKQYLAAKARRTPPVSSYVTMADLEMFKNELLGSMPKTIYKEVPVDRIVPKVIPVPIETVREKVVQVVQPPKKISGNELIDSIFFR
tara:strand:+ start:54 stop:575 length:522 start_codon:yes stop_codon:yes gene_type:complete